MEPIWEVVRRLAELVLDDKIAQAEIMPEGEEKADLTRQIHELDELLMAQSPL